MGIASDVLDPSAVCGNPHEALYWIRNQSVLVDHADDSFTGPTEWRWSEFCTASGGAEADESTKAFGKPLHGDTELACLRRMGVSPWQLRNS